MRFFPSLLTRTEGRPDRIKSEVKLSDRRGEREKNLEPLVSREDVGDRISVAWGIEITGLGGTRDAVYVADDD